MFETVLIIEELKTLSNDRKSSMIELKNGGGAEKIKYSKEKASKESKEGDGSMDETVMMRHKLPAPLLGIAIVKDGSRNNEIKYFEHNVWVDSLNTNEA
jgi:hypothetical protein